MRRVSASRPQKRLRARISDDGVEARELGLELTSAEPSQAVGLSPRLAAGRFRGFGRGFDPSALDHTVDGFVERARAELERALRSLFDVLLDAVAVPFPIHERQEDVEGGWREKLARIGHISVTVISMAESSAKRLRDQILTTE